VTRTTATAQRPARNPPPLVLGAPLKTKSIRLRGKEERREGGGGGVGEGGGEGGRERLQRTRRVTHTKGGRGVTHTKGGRGVTHTKHTKPRIKLQSFHTHITKEL